MLGDRLGVKCCDTLDTLRKAVESTPYLPYILPRAEVNVRHIEPIRRSETYSKSNFVAPILGNIARLQAIATVPGRRGPGATRQAGLQWRAQRKRASGATFTCRGVGAAPQPIRKAGCRKARERDAGFAHLRAKKSARPIPWGLESSEAPSPLAPAVCRLGTDQAAVFREDNRDAATGCEVSGRIADLVESIDQSAVGRCRF